jgi:hypothetical protein
MGAAHRNISDAQHSGVAAQGFRRPIDLFETHAPNIGIPAEC